MTDKARQHEDGYHVRKNLDELDRDRFMSPKDYALQLDLKRLGKTKEQAGQIMLKWHDIRLTGMQLQFNQNSLPSDPERITVRVKG